MPERNGSYPTDHPLVRFGSDDPPLGLSPGQQDPTAHYVVGLPHRIVNCIADVRASCWKMAEALAEFDLHRGWLRLGYESKAEWLADPEISMTESTYFRLVGAWRCLHE